MVQEMEKVGVVGAGQMGAGIAQVAAAAGCNVRCTDISKNACDKGKASVAKSLARLVKKERISEKEADTIATRIVWSTDPTLHADREIVIEAASENEELKKSIFAQLDACCPAETIFATNTSSISIGRLAASTTRSDRFIGMHFMNPVPIMKLVEMIRGIATSDETYQRVNALAERFGKTTTLSQDFPGFIANRILMPMINEAFFTLMEGVGSAEDIDTTMKLGTNQPMGPLALADFIGLDTCLAIMRVLHDGLGDSKYRPCPLLIQYVDAGFMGRKSGRGVYTYD